MSVIDVNLRGVQVVASYEYHPALPGPVGDVDEPEDVEVTALLVKGQDIKDLVAPDVLAYAECEVLEFLRSKEE